MKTQLIVLPKEQRLYTYANSQQISMQTGLIGHLRADMGTGSNGFFSTWFDFRKDLKTDEFKTELDEIINDLRSELLKSRSSIRKYGCEHPETAMAGNCGTEYGVRVNTQNYAYLLRMNPNKGDYNLYCYCYRREHLDNHLKNAQNGIRFITPDYNTLFTLADGDRIRIMDTQGNYEDKTVRYVDAYHTEIGTSLFHICEFAERTENKVLIPLRTSLPEMCYSTFPGTGEVVILKRGKSGYSKTSSPNMGKEDIERFVDQQNAMLGVTKAQEEAMKIGAVFGFDVHGADPANYDENGKYIPKKKNGGQQ